jgi:hypothetical protein
MNRLITDPFVRQVAQSILLTTICLMGFILLVFVCVVTARASISLSNAMLLDFARYLHVMSFPFKETFAPFIVIFAGLVPMALATVCFAVSEDSKATDTLNRVGHAAIVCLITSLLIGAIALVLLAVAKDSITLSVGSEAIPAIQGFVAALVSFQASFLVQLLGVTPK